jgi:hypothetical protein
MRKLSSLIIVGLLAFAGSARAQDEAPAAAPAADPAAPADGAAVPAPAPEAAPPAAGTTYVARGLTQSAGNLQITVPIVLNLSKDLVLKPVWVPLDLRYGVTDQLEIFLNHGAPVGPIAETGGVCLGGKERGCDKFYNNLNIGAQFSVVKDAAIELAAIGALVVQSLDPSMMSVDLGVNFKYLSGPLAIKAAPQVVIGVNKRDVGNKEWLYLPVQVAFQATNELAAFLDTGIAGMFDGFGDNWVVPVGVGASFALAPNFDVGGEFFLSQVATGISGNKAFDNRSLAVFAQYRLK